MDVSASERSAGAPAAGDFGAIAGTLAAATGGAAPHHALQLMQELADAASPGGAAGAAAAGEAGDGAGAARVVAAIEAAIGLAPGDPLEAMLVAQMAAVHAAAMRCLGRTADCADRPQIEALYLRLAARLMNLFVRQAEALDRRARRLGRTACAADGPANGAETAEPDGRQVLDKLLAGIYERRRAKDRAKGRARTGQRTENRNRKPDSRKGDPPEPDP